MWHGAKYELHTTSLVILRGVLSRVFGYRSNNVSEAVKLLPLAPCFLNQIGPLQLSNTIVYLDFVHCCEDLEWIFYPSWVVMANLCSCSLVGIMGTDC